MRKRVIWLKYYGNYPRESVYTALRQLRHKYPDMDIEIHKTSGWWRYVRLELPNKLSKESDESILSGMDINYSVLWSYGDEMFNYLRNTPKNIEYDEKTTKEVLNAKN